jgi:hypothetical protein
LTADPLEELASSIERPLRFYREADEGQRRRIHLPVRAWVARVAEARRTTDPDGGAGAALAALDQGRSGGERDRVA